ncbi:MAG: pseudouridine synthase [Patescibacteria group bacterium]
MRINQYLAKQGYTTRRGADELIRRGQVTLSGRLAVLGDQVSPQDRVVVAKVARQNTDYRYFAYHKPMGEVTGPKKLEGKIYFPIGRLDKASRGLLLLTNDGRITDRLLNPNYDHEKEYAVETRTLLRPSFKKYMEAGVEIEGLRTKPCRVEVRGDKEFRIKLTEGKKHQIRRMVSSLHNEVSDLKRVRIMNIKLDELPAGALRAITGTELTEFLASLGL